MFNICIPVLNNYTGLIDLLLSLINTKSEFNQVWVIDNGGKAKEYDWSFVPYGNLFIHSPGYNLGVAGSWNWFIHNVESPRIIMNDDIQFLDNSLKSFEENYLPDKFCWANSTEGVNSFSFFYLPDNLIKKVGYFDETISPNYAYYEDNDYAYRLRLIGEELHAIPCELLHEGSQTLRNFSKEELDQHHKKFRTAQFNYIRKWGGIPGREVYRKEYNL